MFRFTIRDLLWLMVVVGLAVGWLADRSRIAGELDRHNIIATFKTLDEFYPNWREDTARVLRDEGILPLKEATP